MSARREVDQAVEAELACWPGVQIERSFRGRHPKITLTHGDRSLFVVYSGSRHGGRGIQNHVAMVRKVLRRLGAKRQEASPCR